MDMKAFRQELVKELKEIRARTEGNGSDYTKGYIDAFRYIIEWADEFI